MDIFAFASLASLLGLVLFFVACSIYFVFTKRPLRLAVSLSWKMLVACVIGLPLAGIGGIALSAYLFQAALEDREDFLRWREILVGALISAMCTIALFFAYTLMAFAILQ